MPTVRRDDAEIAYTTHGEGPGLVLVHGTGATGITTWSPLLKALTRDRMVVLPDLRGSGATKDHGGPLDLDTLAGDVLAVALDAGLEQFDLAGFSLGGAVAGRAASIAPEKIRSLSLIATPASGKDSRSRLQFTLWRDLYSEDPELFARFWLLSGLSPGFLEAIPESELATAARFPIEAGIDRQCALNTELDLTPILGSIGSPTLVLGCRYDAIVPVQQTETVAGAIPGALYQTLDAGHLALLEVPGVVARKIAEHAGSF